MPARFSLAAFIALVFVGLLPSEKAAAASFDCAAATKPLEKLICADAELSKLDEEMAKAYGEHLAQFSEEAHAKLRQGQRSWLKMVRMLCGYWIDHAGPNGETALSCLKEEYSNRLPGLQARGNSEPYRFFYVSRYEVVPMRESSSAGDKGELVRHELAYPQIDAPRTPETERWNKVVAEKVEGDYLNPGVEADLDTVDYDVGYRLNSVFAGFIGGEFWTNYYARGWPHPGYYSGSSNYLLEAGKELTANDIFSTQMPWQDGLAIRALPIIKYKHPDLKVILSDISEHLSDPRRWTISAEALRIEIDLNRIYGYGKGVSELDVPWSEIKSYLRPDLPIALKLD